MNGMTIRERLTKLETEMIGLKRIIWVLLAVEIGQVGVMI